MKIYISNITDSNGLGGGWTFLRNFHKGMNLIPNVDFVNNWKDCDIIFVFGITTINKGEIHEAVKADKKLVLRVDNIPRPSRNKRMKPVERLAEFGNIASLVVYQSNWCKEYAGYFINNENNVIINNGVNTEIFNTKDRNSDGKTYLYINYNDNPNKRFDEALYWFDMEWRKDKDIKLYIAGNIPRIYAEHPEYNWDLTGQGKVEYIGILNKPEHVANIMKRSDFLLYPSFAEAYPNTLLEAMACRITPIYLNNEGGSIEAFNNSTDEIKTYSGREDLKSIYTGNFNVKTIEEMCNEYHKEFKNLLK